MINIERIIFADEQRQINCRKEARMNLSFGEICTPASSVDTDGQILGTSSQKRNLISVT